MLENCILFSWENRNSKEQTWLVTCSAKMKEGKIIAPNRLVKNCSLYLVCIAWRLEQQKVQNWIRFSGKWETWTLWEEQSSVRSQGKALAWWLPKVCASICCQVPRLTPSRGTCLLYLLYVLMLSFKFAQHLEHFPSLSLSWVFNFVIFKTIFYPRTYSPYFHSCKTVAIFYFQSLPPEVW